MSTVRSIERRLYVRRQTDRDMASQAAVGGGAIPSQMEWGGVWAGYMTFAGVAILLLALVLGIGFSSLNPLQASSWAGVGNGAMIWSGIAVLIAIYIGAWVSGRTPRTSKRNGMMRGVTLWGLVLLSALLLTGWITGTAIAATSNVAGSALGAAPTAGVTALQGVLQRNGINITPTQAGTISTQMMSGDTAGAANTLATDANISNARANSVLGEVTSSVTGAATTAGQAAKTGGRSLSWGLFWLALIGLGCAVAGGATGGAGETLLRRPGHAPQPA